MTADHVYVHVPFCARRCVYCDFAIAVRRQTPVAEYVDLVAREAALRFGDAPARRVKSLYFGGGTPSRLGGEGIDALVHRLAAHWTIDRDTEVTLEANPEDVSLEAARAWSAAGVNRVSLGVQSFSPAVLQWMHRTHDVPAIFRAGEHLRTAGINRLSVDLIFALPDGVERDWADDLRQAMSMSPDHLSCYGLTVEEGTPLARTRQRHGAAEIDDGWYAEQFLLTDALLTAAGYEHYEVSNFARPGTRAIHNSAYWHRVPYVGLGPSAHEFIAGTRRWNAREYSAWRSALLANNDPMAGSESPERDSAALESLFLDLRTDGGAKWDPRDAEIVDSWVQEGWAVADATHFRLTVQGWLRMNALVTALTQRRSRY
ncbi:MAG: radical SAM family heme chaperone HemW [Gemmatimonadaceae bacterium]